MSDTDKPNLSAFADHELTTELRNRGASVIMFTAEDCPEWYDYTEVGGKETWFASQIKHLEDRLSEVGNEALDIYASNDGLPSIDGADEPENPND
jgi:hypothetical protein